MNDMKCVFTIDVEDWFHILDLPSTPEFSEWDMLPSHIEKNFLKLLDIFTKKEVSVTCFFLGWVAEKFPGLVKEAYVRGHEVASHGYIHKLVYNMTINEFYNDAVKSKKILENITGNSVLGYRAPGFSVTEAATWYFDKLVETGYIYDSSVFPASRGHGGLKTKHYAPRILARDAGKIIEFPISISKLLGKQLCFFGGGYLRLFPYFLVKRKALDVLKEKRPVIFYIHPREVEPDHPRLPMNFKRKFKSYINLKSTLKKIERILDDFQFTTFKEIISNFKESGEIYNVEK